MPVVWDGIRQEWIWNGSICRRRGSLANDGVQPGVAAGPMALARLREKGIWKERRKAADRFSVGGTNLLIFLRKSELCFLQFARKFVQLSLFNLVELGFLGFSIYTRGGLTSQI